MKTFDVVVVGAGLAGLQCARLLAAQGFQILLVDRKPSVAHSVHTTGIFVRRTLEDFDFPEDCLGPAVRHVTLYSPARRSMELVSPYEEFRVGRMGRLYERFLNQCLDAGVEWMRHYERFWQQRLDTLEAVLQAEDRVTRKSRKSRSKR